MKNLIKLIMVLGVFSSNLFANGVCVVNATDGTYFRLISSSVEVVVENQVAVIKTTQRFKNELGSDQNYKFAFPLTESESATSLKWLVNNRWYEAIIEPTPQDTTLPGGGGSEMDYNLAQYLGASPLYFDIEQPLLKDSIVVVELTYVNLLPYEFGSVHFNYPNDYTLIQNTYMDYQHIDFTINSARTIESLIWSDRSADSLYNDGHLAYLDFTEYESIASADYDIQYSLSQTELGLFGLSTLLPDSLIPDEGGRGFFVFVAEPDPGNNTDVINKVFSLIIDRSGSMGGDKMVQARNAATFIVDHLNEGDKFNIVDFSSDISSFQTSHVDFNAANQQAALTYISTINASGSTNISGAFGTAIPQFSASNDSTANIIIFFTDGEATSGITDTQGILNHVRDLMLTNESDIMVFSFGIGAYINEQLLTLLSTQNNGLAEFLGSDELEDRITDFYLRIKNPVLLNTSMTFSPQVISEAFPYPLPSLYQGQQMIVAGRYNEAVPVDITLAGHAFGQPVSYTYPLALSDSANVNYQFLPKIWAKKKIENLLIQYYALFPESAEALALRDEIITLSVDYSVMTPFTSFSVDPNDPGTPIVEVIEFAEDSQPTDFQLMGNYPNPFNASTNILFRINSDFSGIVSVNIYNSLGQLVRTIYKLVSHSGEYELYWDGLMSNGQEAPSGIYFYAVDFGDAILGGRMTLLK
jgi:Ca-activated chloride channel family protein